MQPHLRALQSVWMGEWCQLFFNIFTANRASLRFTVMHQAYHRAQMTVLMREANLPLHKGI
ncbi:hypothetical protein EG487_12420 [Paenibacillus polymyxa]|nr:hypothetical protein EG487_12420 [Paenibacillus polymyxa]